MNATTDASSSTPPDSTVDTPRATPAPARPARVASRRTLLYGLALVALLLAPFTGIYLMFLMKVLCFALFACAFNLLLGFTGMLSFGHAAYLGWSAYVTGWLVTQQGWGPGLSIVAGTLASALLGLVIGKIAIRRQGIYFAMITLALAQLVYFVCLQAPFTGGENGLQGIARGALFGQLPLQSDRVMYYVVLAVFVAAFLFIMRTVHSPYGQVLKAIGENEPRAVSLGYDVDRYKVLAFVLSSTLAGLAGSLKAIVLGFATLSDVVQSTSGEVILMTLLGGTGTFLGPVVGAAVIVTLHEYLSDVVGSWVTVLIGAVFVACVMAFRRGIVGEFMARFGSWSRRTHRQPSDGQPSDKQTSAGAGSAGAVPSTVPPDAQPGTTP